MAQRTQTISKHTSRAIVAIGLAAILGSAVLASTGCKRMGGIRSRLVAKKLAHSVEIEGQDPITIGRFTGIDVENPWGDVIIDADSDHEKAFVHFRVRKERWMRFQMARQGVEFDPVGEYFTAEYDEPEDTMNQVGTLRIRPTDLEVQGFRPPIDLKITLPRCDGALVRTSRGKVKITGVTGTIEVDNGDDVTEGGDIVIRAGEGELERVSASTSRGDIHLIASPENTGVLDLRAPRGRAVFRSNYGYTDEVMPQRGRWTGIWNDGTNPISLESSDGDARVYVVENPGRFNP